jgi:cysteine desulfurase/selenocysteine lyase
LKQEHRIAGGIVLGTAVDYMNEVGFDNIQQRKELLEYGTETIIEIEGLKIFGTAKEKTSVISFNIEVFIRTILTIIDKLGIAVQTNPSLTHYDFFNIPGTIRASFAFL